MRRKLVSISNVVTHARFNQSAKLHWRKFSSMLRDIRINAKFYKTISISPFLTCNSLKLWVAYFTFIYHKEHIWTSLTACAKCVLRCQLKQHRACRGVNCPLPAGDGELSYPWGVATDNMGFVYVCDKDNHRVQVSLRLHINFVNKFSCWLAGSSDFHIEVVGIDAFFA